MRLSGSGGIGVVLATRLAENNPVQVAGNVDDGLRERDKVGEVEEEGRSDEYVLIYDTWDTGVCEDDAAGLAAAAVRAVLECVAVLIINVTLSDSAELVIIFRDEAVWITVVALVDT